MPLSKAQKESNKRIRKISKDRGISLAEAATIFRNGEVSSSVEATTMPSNHPPTIGAAQAAINRAYELAARTPTQPPPDPLANMRPTPPEGGDGNDEAGNGNQGVAYPQVAQTPMPPNDALEPLLRTEDLGSPTNRIDRIDEVETTRIVQATLAATGALNRTTNVSAIVAPLTFRKGER